MRVTVDSSTLISLAWSGQLGLLPHAPVRLVVPEEVRTETVADGLDRGYADAAAIEQAIKELPVGSANPSKSAAVTGGTSVDAAVLQDARVSGALLTNDLALGRRAANMGVQWLRTADFVVLCVRAGTIDSTRGVAALRAMYSAGRLTSELLQDYLTELS